MLIQVYLSSETNYLYISQASTAARSLIRNLKSRIYVLFGRYSRLDEQIHKTELIRAYEN